jgi:hypothetical protein
MELKEKFINPPKENLPLVLWRLRDSAFPLPPSLSYWKNICSGIIIEATPKQKDLIKQICLSAKKEEIPIFLSLPPFSPFTSRLQATRAGAKEGEKIELAIKNKPIWIGALSFRTPNQPTIIDLQQFYQDGYLKWSAPSGIWEILIITSSTVEKRENPIEVANFLMEELADLTPPLSGFYIPLLELFPFPWRDDFPEEFQRRRGYPFQPSFPSLSFDIDEKSAKFRYDFRRTVYEIWEENLQAIQSSVKKKGLSLLASLDFTEHCWGEMLLLSSQIPLPILTPSPNPLLNELASTLLSSNSSPLLQIELRWSSSPEEIKRDVNYFASLGINGSILSLPSPKIDSSLWEKLLPIFSSHQSRLNFLASQFPKKKKTAMLLPRLSLWSHQRLGEDDEYFRAIERDLFFLTELLHKIHYDFSFADEDDLPNIPDLKTVVIPSTTTLKRSTLSWLGRFYEGGGNLIALGMLPFRSEERRDTSLENDVRALFKVNVEDINSLYLVSDAMGMGSGVVYAVGRIHPLSQGKVYSYQPAVNPDRGEALRQTRQILRNCYPPDLDSLQEEILCLPRGDGLFILLNKGEKISKLNAMLPITGKPYELDIERGRIKDIYTYSLMEDGRIIVPLELHPYELSILLLEEGEELHIDQANFFVENVKVEGEGIEIKGWQRGDEPCFAVIEFKGERKIVEAEPFPSLPPIYLPMEWRVEPEEENILPFKNWEYRKKEGFFARLFGKEGKSGWISVASDYKPEGEVWYRTSFSLREIPADIKLCVGHPVEAIILNGKKLKAEGEISLQGYLEEGTNLLVLLINHNKYPSLPVAYLRGDFSLSYLEGEWIIGKRKQSLEVGSWTEQGFPFYVGTMDYIANFSLPSSYLDAKAILSLGQIKEAVEVEVNGKIAGYLFSAPWELEIEDFLKEGDNEIRLRITNCPPQVYGEQCRASGLLSPAKILFFKKVQIRLPL